MTPAFVLSPRAIANLAAIWRYLQREAGERSADRIESALRDGFAYIAQFPAAGHHRPDLTDQPLRFLSVSTYLIVYRPARRPLEIVAVLHGKRDVKTLLAPHSQSPS